MNFTRRETLAVGAGAALAGEVGAGVDGGWDGHCYITLLGDTLSWERVVGTPSTVRNDLVDVVRPGAVPRSAERGR